MNLHPINEEILEQINKFQTIKELEDYLNSEQFKNLAIELQIENIKLTYQNKKDQKRYIRNIEDNILNIHKNISFSLKNFTLRKRKNIHFSRQILSDKDREQEILTYCGTIFIKTDTSVKNELIRPTSLLENTVFNTGNGGGGTVAQYEFHIIEKHMPNLALHFFLDFEKNNCLLNYRSLSGRNVEDDVLLDIFKIKIQDNENKQLLINRIEKIFNLHFLNGNEKEVNLIQNVINIYSNTIVPFESKGNEKYVNYLQRASNFLKDENNLEKIIEFNLPKNKITEYENTKKIKENVRNLMRNIQMQIFKFGNESIRFELYEDMLNSKIDRDNKKILIVKSEAIKDINFINYAFNKSDNIPKFFTVGNVLENIIYYLNEINFPIEENQKNKNEEIILDILKKSKNEKVIDSVMFEFLYSKNNDFYFNNKELKNYIINEYILNNNSDKITQNNYFKNNHFILVCKYINENKEHNFKIENKDISIHFLSLLIKEKNHIENQLKSNLNVNYQPTLEIIDSLMDRTNIFIRNEMAKENEQKNSKKIKI